jgi:hypothetical protein
MGDPPLIDKVAHMMELLNRVDAELERLGSNSG